MTESADEDEYDNEERSSGENSDRDRQDEQHDKRVQPLT
jgi:hypothetical protein